MQKFKRRTKNCILNTLAFISLGIVFWSIATIGFGWIPASISIACAGYLMVYALANGFFKAVKKMTWTDDPARDADRYFAEQDASLNGFQNANTAVRRFRKMNCSTSKAHCTTFHVLKNYSRRM